MNGLREHLQVLRATLQRLLKTPASTLINILIIGIAVSLPVGGYVLLKNVQSLSANLSDTPQISVYLSNNTSANEIGHISDKLKQQAAIDHIEFIAREVALKKLEQSTGLSDITGGLSENPLPDAFIIYPKSKDAAAMEALRDELKSWPHFELVQLDSAWIHRLEAILTFGRWIVGILAAILSLALIAITFNTIRLQILTRREEIEVAKLIGATDSFIRRPFLYFGFIQGLLGGITAWVLVSCSVMLLNFELLNLSQRYAITFSLQSISPQDSFTLLGFAAYLGWLGAWFSVSQHLWASEPH